MSVIRKKDSRLFDKLSSRSSNNYSNINNKDHKTLNNIKHKEENYMNIQNNAKFTNTLGKYIDQPNPDFWKAYNYINDRCNTLSEELYHSIREYNSYKYFYNDVKKESIEDIESIHKDFVKNMDGLLNVLINKNNLNSKHINRLNKIVVKDKTNIIKLNTDEHINIKTKLDNIEKFLGVYSLNNKRNKSK